MTTLVYRVMARCIVEDCRRWWSVREDEIAEARCACGGDLLRVNMAAHVASLPAAKD